MRMGRKTSDTCICSDTQIEPEGQDGGSQAQALESEISWLNPDSDTSSSAKAQDTSSFPATSSLASKMKSMTYLIFNSKIQLLKDIYLFIYLFNLGLAKILLAVKPDLT